MLKMFDQYQKVSPLILAAQLCLAIGILWTLTGIVFAILNLAALIPSGILNESWIGIFLPNIQLRIGSMLFPVFFQTQYTPQILLYIGISNLPILVLLYYSCVQLKKIFRSHEKENQPFTLTNTVSFKNIGMAVALATIIQFAIDFGYGSFLSLIINTYERRSLELVGVHINVPMVFTGILVSSIFFGLANMFSRGLELKEDSDSIV